MRIRSIWAAALCALLLFGCIDTSTKITVKTDGSGTIEKTIVLSKHLAEFLKSMGMTGDQATIEQGMLNEKALKAAAAQMGQDVAFVAAMKLSTPKGNGYKALYSFKDIAKVKLNISPSADLTMPQAGSGAQSAAPELLTFKFSRGTPATLAIAMPKPQTQTSSSAQPPVSSADAEKMMESMRPLYSDMRIVLTVEVSGKITGTNAAYASGSAVTLIDMDFAKILSDDATFKKLSQTKSNSITDVGAMVKTLPGVKLDTQEVVTISFK
jgi:hypothetical protein